MLKALDRFGTSLGEIDFIEATWNRKWSSCGDFMVYMAAKDYDSNMKYIKNVDRPELGIIQKVEYENLSNGAFVTLYGQFLQALANWGSYRKAVSISASGTDAVESAISSYLSNAFTERNGKLPIAGYSINESSELPASVDINIANGTEAGTAMYDILSNSEYSYYCKPIWGTDESKPLIGLDFIFYKGLDLTETVFFGKAYNNVDNVSYSLDESAERTLYELMITTENLSGWKNIDFSFTETVDGESVFRIGKYYSYDNNKPSGVGECYPVRVLEVALNDIDIIPENETAIIAQMEKEAKLDMLNNYKVEAISANVLQERFYYLIDYDLGDVCAVLIDDLQQMYYARIEEVNETHRNNMIEIELVLGTPNRQKWRDK